MPHSPLPKTRSTHRTSGLTRRNCLLVAASSVLAFSSAAQIAPAKVSMTGSNANRALMVAAPWEIGSLDPSKNGFVFSRLEITETLVEADQQGDLVGGLATRWDVSKDQLTWRFKLRPAAKFHDGTAVTAETALRSLERAKANPGVLGNAPIKRMAAEGDTVVVELTKPFAALAAFLAHNSTQILAASSFNADGSVKAVIGSGPYKISSVSPPTKLEAVRFRPACRVFHRGCWPGS